MNEFDKALDKRIGIIPLDNDGAPNFLLSMLAKRTYEDCTWSRDFTIAEVKQLIEKCEGDIDFLKFQIEQHFKDSK